VDKQEIPVFVLEFSLSRDKHGASRVNHYDCYIKVD